MKKTLTCHEAHPGQDVYCFEGHPVPIEDQLAEYGMWQKDRDNLVRQAASEGISQRRIAALTGLARMTVRSILSGAAADARAR